MRETLHLDGIDIQIDGPESAPTIVMIHGWPDTLDVWDRQVEGFSADYRCVRFTLPGYRQVDERRAYSLQDVVQTIARVVDASSAAQPVILMLHDWGCVYGYAYALIAPRRVSAVVMFDVGDANSPELDAELTERAKIMRASYQSTLAAAWRRGGRLGDGVTRALARALARHVDLKRVHSGMNYPYQALRDGAEDAVLWEHIVHPTLFLYGEKKPFMFHSAAWAFQLAVTPGCEVVAIDAGHWLMVDRPTEVNHRISGWFSQIPDLDPA